MLSTRVQITTTVFQSPGMDNEESAEPTGTERKDKSHFYTQADSVEHRKERKKLERAFYKRKRNGGMDPEVSNRF